jgi:hypothetical protein
MAILKPQQGQHVITADISEIQLTLSLLHHCMALSTSSRSLHKSSKWFTHAGMHSDNQKANIRHTVLVCCK